MKAIKYILILSLLDIVLFVNLNNISNPVWNLMWYSQFYFIAFIAFYYSWQLFNNTIIRSIIISLTSYFIFHMIINVVDIFDHELKLIMYKGKYINYILGLSMGIALLILPLINKIKKWISS